MSIDMIKCRLCFSSDNLQRIFVNQNYQIAMDIFLCTSVKVIDLDQFQLPALICVTCLHDLGGATALRKKAIEGEKIFQKHLKTLINSNEFFQKNVFEPEVSIKLENNTSIKAEPIDNSTSEGHFELLQNIDSIIKNCTTVHDTIFEDVNQRFMNEDNSANDDDDSDQEEEQKKRKYKKKKNRDKLSSDNDRHIVRKQKRSRKSNDKRREDDDDGSLYCEICKQTFTTRGSLLKHMKIKHDFVDEKDRYVCDFCGDFFAIKYYLIRHVKSNHLKAIANVEKSKAKNTDSPIPCEVCGKILRNRGLLKPHMRSHKTYNLDDYYYCDKCPRKFKTRGGCVWHIQQRHILKATFPCPQCQAIYKGKWELKCHIKSKHTTIRDYRCEICGKGFLDKQKLTIHTRIHTGERPHLCNICPQTFIHQTDLRRHIWGHTGERPYKCQRQGCGKGFMKKSELLSHENRCHPENQAQLRATTLPAQFQYQMI